MKNGLAWKILLVIGLCPFIAPLVYASISSWAIFNPIVMYSFVFWPTYVIGFILLIISKNLKDEETRKCQRARENAQAQRINRLQGQMNEENLSNIYERETAQGSGETQE